MQPVAFIWAKQKINLELTKIDNNKLTSIVLKLYSVLDCRTRMAQVEYAFPVDKIHGRISKKHKIGFAHRKESGKNYTTSYGKRSTPVSDDEKQYRSYWGQVASAVAARMKDPTKQPQDQVAFKNQSEYPTLRAYLWHVCSEEINNA